MRVLSLPSTVATAAFLFSGCSGGSADFGAVATAPIAQQMQVGDIPELEVDIGDFYLEIDDRNGDDAGNRDANLCSDAPNGTGGSVLAQPSGNGTACPNPLTGEGGVALDNPNYPGPDTSDPETLGTDESLYVDWASLDPAVHVTPFDDTDVGGADDDIFSPGSCYKADGNSPPKANFTTTGFAANDDYLYILQQREKHQGNEEYHFFFTRIAPVFIAGDADPNDAYDCDIWLWDVRDGDVEVILSYPSTAGLPEAQVTVNIWDGGDQDDTTAEGLIQGAHWTAAPTNVAFVALNLAPNRTIPTEDAERDLEGNTIASAILTEVALDLEAVFGAGCGLNQFVSGISTASSGVNDDIKDVLAPKNLKTGALTTTLSVVGSCEPDASTNFERFDYEVTVALDDGSSVTLPNDDLDVTIEYDCGGVTDSFDDPDDDATGCVGPSPDCDVQFSTAPTFPADCEITATVTGTGGAFDATCTDGDTQEATIFEEMTASLGAGAADVCPVDAADILDPFPFNLEIDGGSGAYSVVWGTSGSAENNTCATITEIDDADADYSTTCAFDLDPTASCATGSVTATVTDDACATEVGPLVVSASRQIERSVEQGCATDTDCGVGEVCDSGFCVPDPTP